MVVLNYAPKKDSDFHFAGIHNSLNRTYFKYFDKWANIFGTFYHRLPFYHVY